MSTDRVPTYGMTGSPFASASEHAASIRERTVSCEEVTKLYTDRIRDRNPILHAIVVSNEGDAIRTARERDADLKNNIVRGPLHGVPVTAKESFNLAGLKTTVNFPQLKDNVASSDA
jgi:amidase